MLGDINILHSCGLFVRTLYLYAKESSLCPTVYEVCVNHWTAARYILLNNAAIIIGSSMSIYSGMVSGQIWEHSMTVLA